MGENVGKGFLCLIIGGAVVEAGHSCQCGVQMGNGCALFKGVLIDIMLSIPLMQGTKKGLPHGKGYLLHSFCRFG